MSGPAPAADIERARALADGPAAAWERRDPARSGWSVGQHLEHAALALGGALAAARRIVAGRGGPDRPRGDEATALLAAGAIPRGSAQAPPSALPSDRPDADEVAERFRRARGRLDELLADGAALDAARGTIDHPALGPLGARDWLAFAAVHTAHHLAIVDELLAATRR